MFCIMPVVNHPTLEAVLEIATIGLFIGAVASVRRRNIGAATTAVLGALVIAQRIARLWSDNPLLDVAGSGLIIVFLGLTAVMFLRYVLGPDPITPDKISGAICVYFLLGAIWANVYFLVAASRPDAFKMPPSAASGDAAAPPVPAPTPHETHNGRDLRMKLLDRRFLYFSFVTLTTVGYGDITPVSPFARALSALEAIIGQMYIAVLVARLVGLHLAQSLHVQK
jgi:uncharacterized membrane protein